MKKEIKKLSLNKKTISNLQPLEMEKKVGGRTQYRTCTHPGTGGGGGTRNGNTCYGHNTCYSCVITCGITCVYPC